jgi:cysteinyl-tRNA synthetase
MAVSFLSRGARRVRVALVAALCALVAGCGGGGSGGSPAATPAASPASPATASGTSVAGAPPLSGSTNVAIAAARNLPANPAWVADYGTASQTDVAQLASTYSVIVIDADPGSGSPNFTPAQIAALKAHGAKVLSYLNVGACETWRTYWSTVPAGFVSCGANVAAQLGPYSGYPEYWMNVGNAAYQNLIVNYVAPRLAATGVDGFMLDNFEIVGHGANAAQGPCDAACAQGGLDLVAQLRNAFPNAVLVANQPPVAAIGGQSGGISFPMLIDGVLAESVFLPSVSSSLTQLLSAWSGTEAALARSAFFTGTLDYVSSCSDTATAQTDWNTSQQAGFSPSVATRALNVVCWWPFEGGS